MSYEPLVSESRFDLKLRAMAGVQGGAVLRRALDLAGLITLESDRPEWLLSGGERLAGGQVFRTSAAGDKFSGILYNPENSGIIGVCDYHRIQANAAGNGFVYRFFRGALATLTAAGYAARATAPLDTRNPTLPAVGATSLQVLDALLAGASLGGAAFDARFTQLNVELVFDGFVVLAPGTGFIVERDTNGVNTVQGAYRWREGLSF